MATTIASIRGGQVEKFAPGDRITYTVEAGQTVRGGRLVAITGNRQVREAPVASAACAGVAMYDGAAGEKVGVASEGVWMLLASGAIAAGDLVVCAAAGAVSTIAAVDATNVGTLGTGATAQRSVIGRALEAIADAATGPVKLIGV